MLDAQAMLEVAIEEARAGLAEGGVPIGAAIFTLDGELVSRGHNRRVQDDDPSSHGETDAFRRAGRQPTWRDKIMVTTLTPCWFCTGMVRQFGFPRLVIGDTASVPPPHAAETLVPLGVEIVDLASAECMALLREFTEAHPDIWAEDGGRT
jgi:creatinine deaminase